MHVAYVNKLSAVEILKDQTEDTVALTKLYIKRATHARTHTSGVRNSSPTLHHGAITIDTVLVNRCEINPLED